MKDLLTVADLTYLIGRNKKGLWLTFGVCFILFSALLTLRYPIYQARAKFQDTPGSPSTIKEKLEDKNPFQSSPFYKGKAYIWMSSSTLLKRVIEQHALQLELKSSNYLKRLYTGFEAHFFPKSYLAVADDLTAIKHLTYDGVKPIYFHVKRLSSDRIEVKGKVYTIPAKIDLGALKFEIVKPIAHSLDLRALPTSLAIVKMKKDLKLSTTKIDSNVIELSLQRPTPLDAEATIDAIMQEYRIMLSEDLNRMISGQMDYLTKRKGELFNQFETAMDEHVSYYLKNIQTHGFMTTQEWIAHKGALDSKFEERLQKLHEQIQSAKFAKESRMFIPTNNHMLSRSFDIQGKKEGVNLIESEQRLARYRDQRDQSEQRVETLRRYSKEVLVDSFDLLTLPSNPLVASGIELQKALIDKEKLSSKEIENLKKRLRRVRHALSDQLSQDADLEKKNQLQFAKKVASLTDDYQGQLNQELSHLEEQNEALLSDQIEQYESESAFLKQKRSEYQQELQNIPEQWMSETVLKLKSDLNYSVLEALSTFVESKSVQNHLMPIEVRPIEHGFALKRPISFLPPLSAALLALFITFCYALLLVVRALMRGIPISSDTLKKLGAKVCGEVSHIEHLTRTLIHSVGDAKTIALFQADEKAFAEPLKERFEERGESVTISEDLYADRNGCDRLILSLNYRATDPEVAYAKQNFDVTVFTLLDEAYHDVAPLIEKGLFVFR